MKTEINKKLLLHLLAVAVTIGITGTSSSAFAWDGDFGGGGCCGPGFGHHHWGLGEVSIDTSWER